MIEIGKGKIDRRAARRIAHRRCKPSVSVAQQDRNTAAVGMGHDQIKFSIAVEINSFQAGRIAREIDNGGRAEIARAISKEDAHVESPFNRYSYVELAVVIKVTKCSIPWVDRGREYCCSRESSRTVSQHDCAAS